MAKKAAKKKTAKKSTKKKKSGKRAKPTERTASEYLNISPANARPGSCWKRFFSLFPKAQPAKIGPAKPPPAPVLKAMLYGIWVGLTLAMSAILAGGIF